MIYRPAPDGSVALALPTVGASSDAAKRLDELIGTALREFKGPKVEPLISEITQVVDESAHGAVSEAAVDTETAAMAKRFAFLLPWSLPTPEVASDADGEIGFDWLGPSGKIFSVAIDRTGRIAYAGRFGGRSKVHGIEQLSTTLPAEILRGIARATK